MPKGAAARFTKLERRTRIPTENGRITVERRDGMMRVVVGPVRDAQAWIAGLFLAATMTGAILTAARVVPRGGQNASLSVAGVIIVLLAVVVFALLALDVLWRLFGQEEIVANTTETTVTLRLLAFRQRTSFRTSEIGNIDWGGRKLMWLRGTRRCLVVKVAGRRVEMRSQLSLPEANHLSGEIWPTIQELQRSAKGGGYRG